MGLSNDQRGWLMTAMSGLACVVGASVICVDILVRQFPGKKNFRIQDSDTFLSASLSLSFGVMLFSALYSMLPSAKQSLMDGGYSPKQASWVLVACFLGGVIGIQLISKVLHRFMPSHVVDCEHTHDEEAMKESESSLGHDYGHENSLSGHLHRQNSDSRQSHKRSYFAAGPPAAYAPTPESEAHSDMHSTQTSQNLTRKPTLPKRVTDKIAQIALGRDPECNCDGPCYGYSDPCGQECFKNVTARGSVRMPVRSATTRPLMLKSATMQTIPPLDESTPLMQGVVEEQRPQTDHQAHAPTKYYTVREDNSDDVGDDNVDDDGSEDSSHTLEDDAARHALHKTHTDETTSSHHPDHHHHHVPTNAFLSIGLQTSIAIAMHKLPEGFITYATNHANPTLGVAVFLALFIHNITEGFAMALPLYLAIGSRPKAMLISFVLGGLSQPLGAAVAWVWFHIASGSRSWAAPDDKLYGGMFAVTAGIMASVAMQLFGQSLDLTHSKNLCFIGAFAGMTTLAIASALTA